MDGQIDIFQYVRENLEKISYGYRGCKGCRWYRSEEGRCSWAMTRDTYAKKVNYMYPDCGGHSFEPDEYVIPRMCSNCKYGNQFEYETKPEYAESLKRHNGYTRQAADDPLEEPNIYCDCHKGSLNRRTEYKDLEWANFGVGHWHRQHEWDTCDNWELSVNDYRDFKDLKEAD